MQYTLPNDSAVAVHDIFDPMPAFMYRADLLFVDVPYNQGMLSNYNNRPGVALSHRNTGKFADFSTVLFQCIADISPLACYIEVGKQAVDDFAQRLSQLYPTVQRWPVTYYRKHPCWIIRGAAHPTALDLTGIDEERCISIIAKSEQYHTIGDLCMGRGLVGLAAYAAGRPFVGTELNQRRLAVLLQKLAKQGATIIKLQPLPSAIEP